MFGKHSYKKIGAVAPMTKISHFATAPNNIIHQYEGM
jgi:hypothetical protein